MVGRDDLVQSRAANQKPLKETVSLGAHYQKVRVGDFHELIDRIGAFSSDDFVVGRDPSIVEMAYFVVRRLRQLLS